MGGTPLPPFTDKIFGKKGVTDLGGTPPLYGQNPQSSIWSSPLETQVVFVSKIYVVFQIYAMKAHIHYTLPIELSTLHFILLLNKLQVNGADKA